MAKNSKPDAAEQPKSDGPQLIPLATAAALLEISEERIRQLSKAGYINIPKRGHTTLVSAVRGYIRFWKDEAGKTTKSAAASRAVDARAEEIQLRIAERKRELIPQEDANMAMDLLAGEVARQLSGLGARVTRDIPLRRKIEAAVNESQGKIATALASSKFLVETGREAAGTDTEDDT